MKLIIDIPDEVYKNPHNYCCYSLANEFKNGIPLEDIKADVINIADGKQSIKVRSVLRILDRIGKESEK